MVAKKKTETGGGGQSRAETKQSRADRLPDYTPVPVDEPAPEVVPKSGAAARYLKLLAPLMETPGQMFRVAEFVNRQAARRTLRRIQEGKVEVPGKVADWTFEARSVELGDGSVGSHLYATYKGKGA